MFLSSASTQIIVQEIRKVKGGNATKSLQWIQNNILFLFTLFLWSDLKKTEERKW